MQKLKKLQTKNIQQPDLRDTLPEDKLESQISENLIKKQPTKQVLQPEMELGEKMNEDKTVTSSTISVAIQHFEDEEVKIAIGKERILSSGESSRDRAKPSDFFDIPSPPIPKLVREDVDQEAQRLRRLIHRENLECVPTSQLSSRPPTESQNLASPEDLSFSQVITSTQKPSNDTANQMDETLFSEEVICAQRLSSPGTQSLVSSLRGDKSPADSQISRSTRSKKSISRSESLSPHPEFRAVSKVLEIKTSCSLTIDSDNENQLNTSIDAPLFRTRKIEGDQIAMMTADIDIEVTFKELPSDVERSILNSSSSSILDVSFEMSQESYKGSVIELDPQSQDLEQLFRAVEKADPKVTYLKNLSDKNSIEPGECFRVTAQITGLLPKQSANKIPVDIKNMLVAFCIECTHLWQYRDFINSKSQRVYQSQKPKKVPTNKKEDNGRASSAVINYLCSEEEHDRVMRSLAETQFPNLKDFEFDDDVFKDYSYCYICPMCKSRGIPDTLCKLEPTFFFWLHLTQQESNSCLHVLASGVHAEYLLGTKADHTLRSQVMWTRTEERIAKLIQHQQLLTLSLRRNPSPDYEICLEYTYVVYSVNHLPNL